MIRRSRAEKIRLAERERIALQLEQQSIFHRCSCPDCPCDKSRSRLVANVYADAARIARGENP